MLTPKQQKLLMFIHERLQSGGVSPSFDEMKDALGLKSKSGIHRMIGALEERGFLRRLPNRARALEIIKLPNTATDELPATVLTPNFGAAKTPPPAPPADMVEIPMHGRIAAGTPIEALENADSHIAISSDLVGRDRCYALEVSGDSMIEHGILDGDTVVIEATDTARDGDIVVALVDREEATLKTLRRKGQHVMLVPGNRDYETQIYDAHQVVVQGRLRGLVRRYH